MADGQTFPGGTGLHRPFAPLTGLLRKTRLRQGSEPVFATPLAALLTRNAMLKQALDEERAASAKMRRMLLRQKIELPEVQKAATPVLAEPPATRAPATPPPQTGADDRGLAAGYPDLGYGLTQRQHQILGLVLAGQPSKNIAADLGISQRTVESHRAAIMHRTGATSLPALARLAIGADVGGDCKVFAGP
jgi:DNA-binding CsgD family transcriptional regulator